MFQLWLEAASAGAGREQELGCSPGARAAGLGRERGCCNPQQWGMRRSAGAKSCVNSSSLQGDVVRFGGSFGPARREVLLCFLPCPCTHFVQHGTLLYMYYLFNNFSESWNFALPLTSEKWCAHILWHQCLKYKSSIFDCAGFGLCYAACNPSAGATHSEIMLSD